MNSFRRFLVAFAAVFVLAIALVFVYEPVPSDAASFQPAAESVNIIATGLHNPRGLAFAPGGDLYVAEAGGNGDVTDDCGTMGDGSTKCYARTGSITMISRKSGEATRVIRDLPSLISANGTAA